MSKPLYFSEIKANELVDNIGHCWLDSVDDLVYLAVIRDNTMKGPNNYLIELGILNRLVDSDKEAIEPTLMTSLYEIPLTCSVNSKSHVYINKTNTFISNFNKTTKIPLRERYVNHVSPLSIGHLKIRPLIAGSAVNGIRSSSRIGTIGMFFTIENDLTNSIFFITNYHNLTSSGVLEKEDLVFQPNNDFNDYNNLVGSVWKYQYHNNKNSLDTTLDYAIVRVNCNAIAKKIVPKLTDNNNQYFQLYEPSILSSGFINSDRTIHKNPMIRGFNRPKIDMTVRFYGASTVISCSSKIRSVNTMVKVTDAFDPKKKKIFKKQLLIKNISTNGDSGSILINEADEAVGLIHAGDNNTVTIANNITDIFYKKDINTNPNQTAKNKIKLKTILT